MLRSYGAVEDDAVPAGAMGSWVCQHAQYWNARKFKLQLHVLCVLMTKRVTNAIAVALSVGSGAVGRHDVAAIDVVSTRACAGQVVPCSHLPKHKITVVPG